MANEVRSGRLALSDEGLTSFATTEHPFTNWSAHQIEIWHKRFPTVEHAYQYKKFESVDPMWASRIQNAKSPYEAKRLAYKKPIHTAAWDTIREAVMLELLKAKLSQHEDVRLALKLTSDRLIVENGSDVESFWGTGKAGNGSNVLGKLWMHLRSELEP